jgi:hypothetical protein
MEYFKLILGLVVMGAFIWSLIRNVKRKGVLHSLIRVDTIICVVVCLYVVVTSVHSLFT